MSLMKLSVADKCQLDRCDVAGTTSVLGLGGNSVVPVSSGTLNFTIESIAFSTKFLVIEDNKLKHDIILGGDFFQTNGLSIDLTRKRISGSVDCGEWELYLNEDTIVYKNVPIYLLEDVTLEYTQPNVVNAGVRLLDTLPDPKCEFFYDWVVEINWHGVAGYQGVVSLVDGKTSVLLELEAYSPKKLKFGTKLGTISTIVEIPKVNVAVDGQLDLNTEVNLEHLNETHTNTVLSMLKSQIEVFSRGDNDIGCTGLTQCKIELTDSTPIRYKPRSFPEPVAAEIERQCDELRELGVIEFSKSPYSAPIIPLLKKDGKSVRLCIDYRGLNRVTKADRFPVPNMSDLIFGLSGIKFFTSLDLVRGYYQVPLHPDSYECTAFSTARNHYHFKRLSFGLKNAPGAFQREMQEILRDFDTKQVQIYIDDILILSRNFDEHVALVREVLHALIQHGVKIKPSKCSWFKSEVTFLGHLVGVDGIRKSEDYVKDVLEFPKPVTVKQLRSFLGLINFQRKFVPQCSVICKPLTKLMGASDRTKIIWSSDMTEAFDKLKELIADDVRLSYPDYSPAAPLMELSTDASKYGAGACLTQLQSGEIRVIAYSSTTFNKAQCNYSVIAQELAAIRWALGSMRGFLLGVPFILLTDHKPLVFMHNMTNRNSRIMRTFNDLSEFNFEVRYKPGKENIVADVLSRLHPSEDHTLSTAVSDFVIPEGLQIIKKIDGGGDSLVLSFLCVLTNHKGQYDPNLIIPKSDLELRDILTNEILNNPDKYSLRLDKSTRQKLKLAKLPGTLPPEEFFLAFRNYFNLQVWVHHGIPYPVVHTNAGERATSEASHRVHLRCSSGIHYDPMREDRLYDCSSDDNTNELAVEECLGETTSECDYTELAVNLECLPLIEIPDCTCRNRQATSRAVVGIGNKKCCALIDTGAQISLISERAYYSLSGKERLESNFVPQTIKISGLGDQIAQAVGIVNINLTLLHTVLDKPVPFALIKDEAMPFCIILGVNFIVQLQLALNYESNSYSFITDGRRQVGTLLTAGPDAEAGEALCLVQDDVTSEGGECGENSLLNSQNRGILTHIEVCVTQKRNHTTRLLFNKVRNRIPASAWTARCLQRFKRHCSKLFVESDALWYRSDTGPVAVVPFPFLVQLLLDLHEQYSHLGRNKLLKLVEKSVWHPSLSQVVSDICSSCLHCQQYKTSAQQKFPPIMKIHTDTPFQLIAVDLLTLPKGKGFIECFVVIDHYSKWASVLPIRNKHGSTIAHLFEHSVLPTLPGKPATLLSDNGPEFISSTFNAVLDRYGINHIYSTPHKPSSNGAIERLNQTIV